MVGRSISFRDHQQAATSIRRGWIASVVIFTAGFALVGLTGRMVYRQAPPIPTFRVHNGTEAFITKEDVLLGQEVWQSIGGQQVGSIWGHGALQAPDWSADWLHREALATIELMGGSHHRYIKEVRKNTYDPTTNEVTITKERARAVANITDLYIRLFTGDNGEGMATFRRLHALKDVTLHDEEKARQMAAFVFWSAWACVTQRPGKDMTYTSNWPQERLVGNAPSSQVIVWSMASVGLLVMGIGLLAWVKSGSASVDLEPPDADPLEALVVTPSMRSIRKWTWTVCFLGGLQIVMGVYIAHISVDGPLGIPKAITETLTYTVARTWHLQSGIFAVATSFLAAGLFLAPVIGGWKKDPPLQLFLCNVLWVCLLVIVVGSFVGEIAAVHQAFDSLLMSQWFGHQGYEYVDLGRFWQYFLFVGLIIWLLLMINGVWPALLAPRTDDESNGRWHLAVMLVCASTLIGFFYSAGFMYNARSNLAVMDYWRFWIVHMWVEGFFEVFITVVTTYIFVRLKVLEPEGAAGVALFTTGVFLFGGIPGMFHHLYFSGTPTAVIAVGACFSTLEVCPLALMGFEASEYAAVYKASKKPQHAWLKRYMPIVDCFIYVAFWNLVGAGFLGFVINPPISLYYMQGGYLTLAHSHGSLWGVYGVLALALSILVLRLSDVKATWNTRLLDLGLKLMNYGMVMQIFLSIFPIGLYQFWMAATYDYWYARSQHFHGSSVVQWLKLARSIGDSIFALGMLLIIYWVGALTFPCLLGRSRGSGASEALLRG